jgi:hypothetical protein
MPRETAAGDAPQFFIDIGHKSVAGLSITFAPTHEELGDRIGLAGRHAFLAKVGAQRITP